MFVQYQSKDVLTSMNITTENNSVSMGNGWVRRKMSWSQAMGTGMVLGVAGFIFSFIIHLYYIALEPSLILRGVKVGAAASIFLFIGGTLVFKLVGRKVWEGHQGHDPIDVLHSVLSPIEQKASSLLWNPDRTWMARSHVRSEGIGTTVDLHDLDVTTGKAVVEVLIAVRHKIGRIRLVTGRGKRSTGEPKMRPAILEMLRLRQNEHGWDMQIGAGTVTLRPRKPRASPTRIAIRFTLFAIPITLAGWLGFSEIGNGDQIAQVIGILSGLFLAAILASFES